MNTARCCEACICCAALATYQKPCQSPDLALVSTLIEEVVHHVHAYGVADCDVATLHNDCQAAWPEQVSHWGA